jgi:hypothetical protein
MDYWRNHLPGFDGRSLHELRSAGVQGQDVNDDEQHALTFLVNTLLGSKIQQKLKRRVTGDN